MRPVGTATSRALIAMLVLASLACRITWREPQVQPLDPSRVYAIDVAALCDGIEPALATLGLTAANATRDRIACLYETEHMRLTERGDRINHLDEVAYVGNQRFFSHGRYLLTVSARPGPQGASVRVTSRIEGYDAGYKILRSTGLIEATFFERLADVVGIEPLDG